jgi:hypothetical protein
MGAETQGPADIDHLRHLPAVILQTLQSSEISLGDPAPNSEGWCRLALYVPVFPFFHFLISYFLTNGNLLFQISKEGLAVFFFGGLHPKKTNP